MKKISGLSRRFAELHIKFDEGMSVIVKFTEPFQYNVTVPFITEHG